MRHGKSTYESQSFLLISAFWRSLPTVIWSPIAKRNGSPFALDHSVSGPRCRRALCVNLSYRKRSMCRGKVSNQKRVWFDIGKRFKVAGYESEAQRKLTIRGGKVTRFSCRVQYFLYSCVCTLAKWIAAQSAMCTTTVGAVLCNTILDRVQKHGINCVCTGL